MFWTDIQDSFMRMLHEVYELDQLTEQQRINSSSIVRQGIKRFVTHKKRAFFVKC